VWPARFTEAARAELIDAQDWYEAEAPGLGRRFRTEIDSVVRRMADNPRQFPHAPTAVKSLSAYRVEHSACLERNHRGHNAILQI